jgi:predicted ATPase
VIGTACCRCATILESGLPPEPISYLGGVIMLTSLSLRNFKCFESVDIPLGRITVLIGENGTGKSSVLHALALLRQSLGHDNLNYSGDLVDLSGFKDVVFKGATWNTIRIGYESRIRIGGGLLSYSYAVLAKESIQELSLRIPVSGNYQEFNWIDQQEKSIEQNVHDTGMVVSSQKSIGSHAYIAVTVG